MAFLLDWLIEIGYAYVVYLLISHGEYAWAGAFAFYMLYNRGTK